jgi:zeta-carotene desaturase
VNPESSQKVLVIGGGIAGIAASVKLASQGYPVTLIEKGPRLGGRAYSFYDDSIGSWVDNCQHILMGCCRNLKELYRLTGSEDKITWQDSYYFYYPGKGIKTLGSSPLPAPFQLLPAFLKLDALSLKDRLNIGRIMAYILNVNPEHYSKWDNISIKDWFISRHVSEDSIKLFWEPILVSALNDNLDNLPVSYVFKTIKWGFLGKDGDWKMGVPSVTFYELYHEDILTYLTRRNSDVRLQTPVKEILLEEKQVKGVLLANGSIIKSDVIISALPMDKLASLIKEETSIMMNLAHYEFSPIMGIHLWFNRVIMDIPHLNFPGHFIHWIFNKNPLASKNKPDNQYLSIVISACQDIMHLSKTEIINQALNEITQVFPEAEKAQLIHSLIIREPRATFRLMALQDFYRPGPISGIKGLILAGDWTDTGWPATMESAALSGFSAADMILQQHPADSSL